MLYLLTLAWGHHPVVINKSRAQTRQAVDGGMRHNTPWLHLRLREPLLRVHIVGHIHVGQVYTVGHVHGAAIDVVSYGHVHHCRSQRHAIQS